MSLPEFCTKAQCPYAKIVCELDATIGRAWPSLRLRRAERDRLNGMFGTTDPEELALAAQNVIEYCEKELYPGETR